MNNQRVVIIGAGFAGISAARTFAGTSVDVLLLDRHNYHTFLPLLHQVATCELEPEHIVCPIRKLLKAQPNVQFATNEVKRVDFVSQVIETNNCLIPYDYLILACGSTSQFFGIPGVYEHCFPLKNLENSVNLRNQIIYCFELAQEEADFSRRQELLTFTIVGGGATGVELAGELAELIYGTLVNDYPAIDFRRVRVVLLQAGDKLLPEMPLHLSVYAKRQLQKMGVEVKVASRVTKVMENAVYWEDSHFKNSQTIPCQTVIWTAGVCGNPVAKKWGLVTDNNGKVTVLPTLQVPEYPQVYIVGDLAAPQHEQFPMLAPVAIQQGTTATNNILRQIKGKNPQPMRYQHQGSMVIIGRHAAVANLFGKVNLTGFVAWLLWLFVHLACLPSTRNRFHVLLNWVWSYFSCDRSVRLILPLHPTNQSKPAPQGTTEDGKRVEIN
ncbi:NAD(P)/FAD-dependent oxidoreductase [Brunnivagina elsteri]|uniref:NADH:ubiquinone reductase (non-electrogenic) n=1 Tax=Brunnivagina elsteri CCALA 953 TaxID=987040 RepID=A0A2A2TG97_9CYAN|nr:NAD(P)/FAD-dependent oxidoreductase [Calothrix elsteri]PAX52668.1 FAD-dependent oxidoreductase [Calothrix elsteri CCALA 953]